MKTSIKRSALIIALISISLGVKAQTTSTDKTASEGIKLSIGVETGLGTGNFKDTHKSNIGGSVQADLPVASQFYANLNAGYVDFIGKDNVLGSGISAPDIHLLPVTAGLKFFPITNLYIQANAGVAFALNKSDIGFASTAAFVYMPQVGYQFSVGGKSFIDAGVRYEGTTSYEDKVPYAKINQIGLRVAYGFGL